MSKERLSELRELLFNLERRIKPLEWDASRNQINEFKRLELSRLQEEQTSLRKELQELEQSPGEALPERALEEALEKGIPP